ncbi:MAG: lactate utilization protein [Clostridia bacterium]|nr:lactate utilization protein [Clostridia bacterium]
MYENIVKALNKNNIECKIAKTKEDALEIVKSMLFKGAVVSNGGSISAVETGVFELLKNGDYNYLDRSKSGITKEEQSEVYKKTSGADFYFCSANALTENGELINVDGNSNRISAIAFGPEKVIMIVGKNKIVKDVDEGLLRVKKIAAPKNCERLNIDNPCRKLGHCISLEKSENPAMTDGCDCERRICRNYLISAKQMQKDRICVILVDENLGY